MAAGDGAPGEQLDGGLAGWQGRDLQGLGSWGERFREGTPAKSPAAGWPGPACLPGREGKAAGTRHHGGLCSPRFQASGLAGLVIVLKVHAHAGAHGGEVGAPHHSGPPEAQVVRSAPAVPRPSRAPPARRQQLSEEELERLEEACDMALELNASKHRIYEYVESRMSFIAPNLSIIIGASTAAKIMGEARPQARGFAEACPFPVNRGVFYTSWGPACGPHSHLLVCPEIEDQRGGRQSWGPAAAGAAGRGRWGGWGPGAAW